MTGRYNYRTRCIDTYIGRAMMDTDEVTLAEFLKDAGYQTGIYGKWHMGDNYPLRAMDQGFQDSLVHRGGGIGQPSDPIGAEGKYTDPTLIKNGKEVSMKGYCTDIYFDAAMEFISKRARANEKFFTYIATNAPHGPFHDVPKELYDEYSQVDFSPILVNKLNPQRLEKENEKLARIAAMITNIDQNVGRLFAKLKGLGILENTIVIYLNDNGPNSVRFVGDMRGMKTAVDDGGIRSPLLFHWPAKVKAGSSSDSLSAHIDLLPTILDACGVDVPAGHKVDGRSFLPLLTGERKGLPQRQVVLQTHRGNKPQQYHHFAIHEHPWKLVHPSGFGKESFAGEPKLELYNLSNDPRQKNDLAGDRQDVAARLKTAY
jgi:arylsulfatase/arylsulfatase A